MNTDQHRLARVRTRWSAIGAAVAITLGAGGIGIAQAGIDSGDKPVTVTTESKRIVDTRDNLGLAGAFAKDTPRDVQVTGSVDVATPTGSAKETVVPPGATGVLVNVTVVTPTDGGFLTLRPAGATGKPTTSTVNFTTGSVEPNAATVDLSADGKIQVWVFLNTAAAKADVIIDVVGYTTDHTHDDRYYTESETDTKLAAKANTSALASKANTADVYTKSQVDAAVAPKADSADVYTKAQVDAAVAAAGGVEYSRTAGSIAVTDAVTVLESIVVDVPVAGILAVSASAWSSQPDPAVSLRCGLSTSSSAFQGDQSANQYVSSGAQATISMTRGFEVGVGQTIVYFLCRRDNAGTDFTVFERNMTAVYSANRP